MAPLYLLSRPVYMVSPRVKPFGSQRRGISGLFRKMRYSFNSFSFKQYFNEEYFWKKANLGPPFIFLLTSPWWIEGLKSIYWSFRYRSLNQQEILSDRFAWLHERMLEDDVERIILKKVPDGGFKKDGPALMLGPSYPERLSY